MWPLLAAGMGGLGFTKRENPIHNGLDAAGLDQRPDLPQDRVADGALFRFGTGHERRRHQAEALHQHQAKIDLRLHAALEGDVDNAPLSATSAPFAALPNSMVA